MASIRQNIAKALITTTLTDHEISDDLQLKPSVIRMELSEMENEGIAVKGEYLEGEGQLWAITEKGIALFASKEAVVEIKKRVAKVKKTAAKPKGLPLSELKSVALADKSKTVCVEVVSDEPGTTPVVSDKIENVIIKDLNPQNFAIHKAINNAVEIIISHYEPLITKREIYNFDYKIATLEALADTHNSKIGATLREIASDLRG